uniref:GRIP domain-containing protein n=1 Tax=Schistocephalus solidus TaxID=70667 RepID=A0A0X3PDA4_SCHSO
MFANLQSKVAKTGARKQSSDTRSLQVPLTTASRTNSNESLVSAGSAAGSVYHKSDRIRHLESKVSEFGSIIRQKNAALETARQEIEHLTTEIAKVRADVTSSQFEELEAHHKETKMLLEKLRKAEEELASVNQLSNEVSRQNTEYRQRTALELEALKSQLTKAEETIRSLQEESAHKVAEVERLSRELAQQSKELQAKNEALENTKNIRLKLLTTQTTQEETIRRIRADKEAAELKANELAKLVDQLGSNLRRQESATVEEADKAASALAEADKLRARVATVEARAADRESDLKDRIRMLEERLVLLTEPSSELFADQVAEATKELPETAQSPLPEGTSPEAARCITLLVERKLLETRLHATRKHLEDVKTTWNEKLTTLESQIAHLNSKIAEDTSEYMAATSEWERTKTQLESQLSEVRSQYAEARATISRLEAAISERDRETEESVHDRDLEKSTLTAKITALEAKAEEGTQAYALALKVNNEQASRILALESQLTERDRAGERQSAEIQEARARSESLDAQIVSMRSELDGLRQTVTEKETLANRAADNLDAANKTIADFRSQMAELEAKCKTEVEGLNIEVASLKADIAKLSTERETTNQQLKEAQAALAEATTSLEQSRKLEEELHLKITELEKQNELHVQNSVELQTLKETIESLNEIINERNKTIRLQKQKLTEFKRALGQGLQGAKSMASSSTTLADEESQSTGPPLHLSASTSTPVQQQFVRPVTSVPPSASRPPEHSTFVHSTPITTTSSSSSLGLVDQSKDTTPSPNCGILPVESLCPLEKGTDGPVSPSYYHRPMADFELVNFDYLRHVIVKFLLSRESEALQLVRAVSALLRLSKEDEFLIRQTLEARRSWFTTPMVSPKRTGQFAKVISPPH